jgi:hypothetical protein
MAVQVRSDCFYRPRWRPIRLLPPDSDPKDELLTAAARLKNNHHHPNAIGIQFVQIGNDSGADAALKALAALQIDVSIEFVGISLTRFLNTTIGYGRYGSL